LQKLRRAVLNASMLHSNRKDRELALQIMYLLDAQGFLSNEVLPTLEKEQLLAIVRDFFVSFAKTPTVRTRTVKMVVGVLSNLAIIDDAIKTQAKSWSIDRMDVIDRNLLRVCCFELLIEKKAPIAVVINEGIEIAKRFANYDSASFVNGLLDNLAKKRRATSDNSIEIME